MLSLKKEFPKFFSMCVNDFADLIQMVGMYSEIANQKRGHTAHGYSFEEDLQRCRSQLSVISYLKFLINFDSKFSSHKLSISLKTNSNFQAEKIKRFFK